MTEFSILCLIPRMTVTSLIASKNTRCKTHPLCVNLGVPFWTREKTHKLRTRWQVCSCGIRADVTVVLNISVTNNSSFDFVNQRATSSPENTVRVFFHFSVTNNSNFYFVNHRGTSSPKNPTFYNGVFFYISVTNNSSFYFVNHSHQKILPFHDRFSSIFLLQIIQPSIIVNHSSTNNPAFHGRVF